MTNTALTTNQNAVLRTISSLRGKADLAALEMRLDNAAADVAVLIASGLVTESNGRYIAVAGEGQSDVRAR